MDTPASAPARTPAALVFAIVLLVVTVTFGASFALLVRSQPVAPTDEEPIRTIAPARASATAAAAPSAIRAMGASGTAERLDTGSYRVSFAWTLEGARDGDTAVLRFSVGSRVLTEQRGTLDSSVFTPSTGALRFATSQECSTEGWSAEIVSVRGIAPTGDTVSRVAGVSCR